MLHPIDRSLLASTALSLAALLAACDGEERTVPRSSPGSGEPPAAAAATAGNPAPAPAPAGARPLMLIEVAAFPQRQITGVAVSSTGRLFVNAPFWPGQEGTAVLEVLPDGESRLYPSEGWHGWRPGGGLAPEDHFVCVQSVWIDDRDRLWILDPASPLLSGVVPGGAKLVVVDLATDEVLRVYRFGPGAAPPASYLNDVRVDTERGFAYLTDSGTGALVVLDLTSGEARRLLEDHPSTHAEPGLVPVIGGGELRGPNGSVPQIHADGIALDATGDYLYYHALTGEHLYRVATAALRNPALPAAELGQRVEHLGETVVTDGMLLDPEGRVYHTALERDALVRWWPGGELETLITDERLRWPDSLSWGSDGYLYVTTSQIHLSPLLGGPGPTEPYRVWKVPLP